MDKKDVGLKIVITNDITEADSNNLDFINFPNC